MSREDTSTRWERFSEQYPDIAGTICEQALAVCEHGSPGASLESEELRTLRDSVAAYHKELGLPLDMSEADLLRWATEGVFRRVYASENR